MLFTTEGIPVTTTMRRLCFTEAWRSVGGVGALALAFALTACGGGGQLGSGGAAAPTAAIVSGYVVKGPVATGTVTAYKLDASMVRGDALATATTDASGAFAVKVPAYNGPLEVVANSGTYIEEALGSSASLAGHELTAVVSAYQAGKPVTKLMVTPVSTMVAALARYHVQARGEKLEAAVAAAQSHLNSHFGNLDWSSTLPADVTSASVATLSPESTAGFVLAALSQQALAMSKANNVTPGLVVTGATLAEALALDLADGTLDGNGPSGALSQSQTRLDGQTARRGIGQAVLAFAQSARNASRLTVVDVRPLATAIAGDSDPYLFCPGQTPASSCAGAQIDVDPPAVTFSSPVAGAGVHGSVAIAVSAADANRVASLAFTAPTQLMPMQAVLDDAHHSATLAGMLDVSALPDGPLVLTVASADEFGNTGSQSVTVQVANHGPTISISVGSDSRAGATVSGTVQVAVTTQPASAGATVQSLVAVSPPPGLGANTQSAAGVFSAAWDTAKALEGTTTLHFRATDSYGQVTDATLALWVDNVPFGRITAAVSAGAPVQGAQVKILAIENATGQPNTAVGAAGVLGQGAVTDASGTLTVTLDTENYEGPIQVVAVAPTSAGMTYVDPTNPASTISLPSSQAMTTFVGNYKTGNVLTLPVTLLSSLSDSEALAFVKGRHRCETQPGGVAACTGFPSGRTLVDALAFGDTMFAAHLSAQQPTWDLRSTIPVSLTQPPTQTLRDQVYAALFDVALNQLAKDTAVKANLGSGNVITAPGLLVLLQQDLLADGQFDGLGDAGTPLQTPGSPPVTLDVNFLRNSLATALDEFVQSARNTTGLVRSDFNAAAVYNAISNDTSLLFGDGSPVPFDNAPPSVAISVTYGASQASPVGATRAVAGSLSVTVVTSDPSGVDATTFQVKAGSAVLPGVASQGADTTTATWTGAFDSKTVADGALAFSVVVADRRANTNAGVPATTTVLVDNTPPVIAATAPAVGASYSASVPVAGSATDSGSGVASLAATGLAGFADVDTGVASLNGTWAIPGGQADGAVAGAALHACDAVGNCADRPLAITVDRTPPVPNWVSAPPSAVNAASLNLAVLVADAGAGVGTVYAQASGTPVVLARNQAGAYAGAVTLLPGHNAVTVWATDLAVAANSGAGKGAPYVLSQDVMLDLVAPTITLNTAYPAYYSEAGMSVAVDGAGRALVPAQYRYPAGKVPLAVDSVIYKAAGRLDGPFNAGELEATNANNLPFMQVSVPYYSGTDAPITAVTATTFLETTPTQQIVTPMQLSPTSPAGVLLFDVPLTPTTVTGLDTIGAGGNRIHVGVTVKDAAGNTSLSWFTFYYHVIAPPLAWAEDAAYVAAGDLNSPYPYKIANPTYQAFRQIASPNFANGGVRYVRYLVTNPQSVPVGVAPALSPEAGDATASHSISETWAVGSVNASQMPATFTGADGTPQYGTEQVWGQNGCGGHPRWLLAPGPFTGGAEVVDWAGVAPGLTLLTGFSTIANQLPAPAGGGAGGALYAVAYQATAGGDGAPASAASNGSFLVPAAANGQPGMLAVYVAGHQGDIADPGTNVQSRIQWLSPTPAPSGLPQSGYLNHVYDVWALGFSAASIFNGNCATYWTIGDPLHGSYYAYSVYTGLTAAHANVRGWVSAQSTAILPNSTTATGDTGGAISPVEFTRTVAF